MAPKGDDALPTPTLDYARYTGGGGDDEGAEAAPTLGINEQHWKYLAAAVLDNRGAATGPLAFAEDAVAAAGSQ